MNEIEIQKNRVSPKNIFNQTYPKKRIEYELKNNSFNENDIYNLNLEEKNFVKIIEEDDSLNEENDDDIDLEDDKKANEDEDDDDYDESSSGDSVRYFGKNIKNKNARKEIKLRIK